MPIDPYHDSGMRAACADLKPIVIDSSTRVESADIVGDSESTPVLAVEPKSRPLISVRNSLFSTCLVDPSAGIEQVGSVPTLAVVQPCGALDDTQ